MNTHLIFLQFLRSVLLSAAILLAVALSAQTHEMDLESAIQYALEENVQVQNARFEEYIAKAEVREILSEGLPQINAQAQAQYQFAVPRFVFVQPNGDASEVVAGLPWNGSISADLSQLVADGRYFIGLKAASEIARLSKKQAYLTQQDIAFNVTEAYYTALIARESQGIVQANLERVTTTYEETKALWEAGFAEEIDVERLEISKNNLEVDLAEAERNAQLTQDLLKFQMGMPIEENVVLTEDIERLREMPATVTLDDYDYTNRIEYEVLQSQLQLQNYNRQRYQMGYVPSLYAFGTFQRQYQWDWSSNTDPIAFNAAGAGLTLNVPIFDGLRKSYQIQQTKLEIKKIQNNLRNFENSVNLEVKSAWQEVQNTFNNLRNLQRNRDLAQKVYRVAETKYKEGVGSSLEVNTADADLKNAEVNYLRGAMDYLLAKAKLQRARGEFSRYQQD